MLAVAAFMIAVGGCHAATGSGEALMVLPGEGKPAGMVVADARDGAPYVVGDLVTCLDHPGHVTIQRIEPQDPIGELRIEAFAVVPNTMETTGMAYTADENKSLADQGLLPGGPVTLDQECPDFTASPNPAGTPKSVQLLIQYGKSGGKTAGNHGITVYYTSEGHEHHLFYPWQILLCAPGDVSTEMCRSTGK